MGLCNCKELVTIRVEGEMGADPLWCDVCQYNFDIDDIELTEELKSELFIWVNDYASWVDWEFETLIEGQEHLEIEHNEAGKALTEKVKEQLNGQYKVVFSPSTIY